MIKQDKDSYKLYQGQYEEIIDEETWYRGQVKRAKNAFKRDKTYSFFVLIYIVRIGKMSSLR